MKDTYECLTKDEKSKMQENIEALGYDLVSVTDTATEQLAQAIGYQSLNKQVNYDDGATGILVKCQLPYNNGIYIMKSFPDLTLHLEVIVANTKDKTELITKVAGDIDTYISGLDTTSLEVYDLLHVASLVISKSIVKPLAELQHIPDELKEKYRVMYMPRFLANMARFYVGDPELKEEQVNSEPFVLKEMLTNPKFAEQYKNIKKGW